MNKSIIFIFCIMVFFILSLVLFSIILLIITFLLFIILIYTNGKYIIAIFLFFPIFLNVNFVLNQEIKSNQNNYYGEITKVYTNSIFVDLNNHNVYLNTSSTSNEYYVGDHIEFNASFQKKEEMDSFWMFLISNKTTYYAYVNNVTILNHKDNYRNKLVIKLQNDDSLYASYSLAVLYKKKDDNNEHLIDEWSNLGISHLFIISGFQIGILYLIFTSFLAFFIKNKNLIQIITMIFTFYFLYITFFPISGIRAYLYQNTHYWTKLNKKKSLFITGIIMLIINPLCIFSLSLILSFSITNLIININSQRLSRTRSSFTIAICSFLLALPIITIWNTKINLFSPFLTIFLSPLVFWIYIIIIIFLPFSFLWKFLNPFFIFLNFLFYLISFIYLPIYIPMLKLKIHILFFFIILILFEILFNKKKN